MYRHVFGGHLGYMVVHRTCYGAAVSFLFVSKWSGADSWPVIVVTWLADCIRGCGSGNKVWCALNRDRCYQQVIDGLFRDTDSL
jgi:hypothetical protein